MISRALRLAAFSGTLALACALTACTTPTSPAASNNDSAATSKPSETPSAPPTIEPIIAVASVDVDGQHLTASGGVQGVVEDGGTCTFEFSRPGAESVVLETQGQADRSSTVCGAVQPETSKFTRGTWTVVLSYTSPEGTFHSHPQTMEVP